MANPHVPVGSLPANQSSSLITSPPVRERSAESPMQEDAGATAGGANDRRDDMNMMTRISATQSTETSIDALSRWNEAMQRLENAQEAYDHYKKCVWDPAWAMAVAFEQSHGLISPGVGGTNSTRNFNERRQALKAAYPTFFVSDEIEAEIERLSTELSDAQSSLMGMEAPDLAALRWKLDHVLEIECPDDVDGGSTPCWSAHYVAQTVSDYRRLLT